MAFSLRSKILLGLSPSLSSRKCIICHTSSKSLPSDKVGGTSFDIGAWELRTIRTRNSMANGSRKRARSFLNLPNRIVAPASDAPPPAWKTRKVHTDVRCAIISFHLWQIYVSFRGYESLLSAPTLMALRAA